MEPSITQPAPPSQPAAALKPAPPYLSAITGRLTDMAFLGRLHKQIDEVVLYNDLTAAASILRDLDTFLRAVPDAAMRYPEPYPLIMRIKLVAQWVALNTLPPDEVYSLFHNHLTVALALPDYELWEHVRLWLLNRPLRIERDEMKKKLREAMEGNREPFGATGAVVSAAAVPKTLGEWMSNFFTVVGREKPIRAFEVNTFLNRDQYMRTLSPQLQTQLRTFLELYERLQRSSQILEGFEDTVSVDDLEFSGTFRDGRYEFINREEEKRTRQEFNDLRSFLVDAYGDDAPSSLVKSLKPGEYRKVMGDRLLDAYARWSQVPYMNMALMEYQESAVPHSGALQLLEAFYASINQGKVKGVAVSLWRLARAGKVREAFADSQRYRNYWRKHLPPALNERVLEFEKDPAASEFLLAFLRHTLEERLKMKEEDAKLAILTMSNECRKAGEEEYAHLAYGDLRTGEFRWGP